MNASVAPNTLAADAAGNVYFSAALYAPNLSRRVLKLSGTTITVIAGNGIGGYSGDGGPATSAQLRDVAGIAVDPAGNVYIADDFNSTIRKISPNGIITTIAGTGTWGYSGDGGPATGAQLSAPLAVAADGSGNLYILDNSRIRKVSPGGIITTIAGNVVSGYYLAGLAVDRVGNVYFTGLSNCEFGGGCETSRIQKVSPNGIITTVARGTSGYAGDGGPAANAQLNDPSALAMDGAGNLYIADSDNNRIRRVSPDGVITTVAGNGTYGYSGDGGPASSGRLSTPTGLAVDSTGNLYIADTDNFRIRKVSSAGILTTIAGNGTFNYLGDGGPATGGQLSEELHAITLDGAGNLYIADQFNLRVRRVSANGTINTIVGSGMGGVPATGVQPSPQACKGRKA
jgi:sugar lactone lactonase YvrE